MLTRIQHWVIRATTALIVSVVAALPASAQCAMCYLSASGSGAKVIHALKGGILILLIPTLAILASIVIVSYRARKGQSQNWPSDPDPGWDADWTNPHLPEADGASLPR